MSRHTYSFVRAAARVGMLAASVAIVTACQRSEPVQNTEQPAAMDWAHAALERNPQLEIVATDRSAEVFTIRDKQTGELRTIELHELAAAPVTQLAQRSDPSGSAPPTPEPETPPAPSELSSAEQSARPEPTQPAAGEDAHARTNNAQTETLSYTIERSGGQIRVSGPGVSIVSTGGTSQAHEGVSHGNSVEPIICEGRRMMHLDGRQIFVEGNAITVRGGCELYLTNSRIVATGTALVVQDGTAHVSNSTIEGQDHSFDVGDEAKLFARASTFTGIPRRSERAVVQDQGGNRWR